MTDSRLMSPADATRLIAEMFEQGGSCKIFAREDRSFDGARLLLGDVSIRPIESEGRTPNDVKTMIASEEFEWRLPSEQDMKKNLSNCLGDEKGEKIGGDVDSVLDNIISIAVRAGLLHPVIDAAALEEMPFRRATTIVSDTSGVLQGALDFVSRNLHPTARVKIPAIVHMEIVESADRFLSMRRRNARRNTPPRRVKELMEHMKSQGGQRALLRMELHSDTEIERTWLFGDPLRHAFQRKNDTDLSGLNISVPVRSYVDRLILEDARHHQAQCGPNHRVRLLTGDQGQARMALAEGVMPIYFSKIRAADFFGSRLAGQTFDPFSGEVRRIPLVSILWELAVAFGSARLENDAGAIFDVVAIGEGTSWSPYHSFDDLLWCKYVPADRKNGGMSVGKKISFPQFDVNRMLRLICAFDDNREMTNAQVLDFLGTRSRRGGEEYRRFLTSANLIAVRRDTWSAEADLQGLSAALRNERTDDVRDALECAPSFSAFAARIRELDVGRALDPTALDPSYRAHGATTYRALGEMTLLCASAFGAGPFATPAVPDAGAFAEIALRRFSELDDGDGLVAVGEWLETMIREDGIHPEVARRKLEEAYAEGLLRRFTEGSTPELRYGDRVVHVLRTAAGEPMVQRVRLYRGDYLIPGKASVSLRIEGTGR